MIKYRAQLVALQLIWGEQTKAGRIRLERQIHVLSNNLHAGFFAPTLDGQLFPIGHGQRSPPGVDLLDLTKASSFVFRYDGENLVNRLPIVDEKLARLVRREPSLESFESLGVSPGIGNGDLVRVERAFDEFTLVLRGCTPTLETARR